MEIVLVPPNQRNLCSPISNPERPFSECLVANVTIRQWLTKALNRAGFTVVDTPIHSDKCVRLPVDHSIEIGALIMLSKMERSTVLLSEKNEILAWKGVESPEKAESQAITQAEVQRIRYPWDMLTLNSTILKKMTTTEIQGTISPLSHISGIARIGEGTEVLPGVVIEGNVIIGKNCRIGPNCFIRGNTSIADHCIIGNAVEIKNSIIYPHTCIAHLSFVGDSILGSHVNLGAGTIISNYRHDGKNHKMIIEGELINTGYQKLGAIIGDGVHTGINTSIYPARKIGKCRTTLPGTIVSHDLM